MTNEEIFAAEEPFRLHAYRKNELALMYFPDLCKESAGKNLRRWIKNCKELYTKMVEEGYDKNRKFYLRREVELIVEYLGLP